MLVWASQASWSTNVLCCTMQIRLYFPEIFHPAYGVLRALVKDSDSTANIASHLDSDGRVGHTNTTTDSQPYDRQFLADGLWHMATLTTLTNISSGLPGYAMLLDGYLVGMQAANHFYFREHCHPALLLHEPERRDCKKEASAPVMNIHIAMSSWARQHALRVYMHANLMHNS